MEERWRSRLVGRVPVDSLTRARMEYYRNGHSGHASYAGDTAPRVSAARLESSQHAASLDRLAELLWQNARSAAIVRVQNPLWLTDDSWVEPDLTLVKRREDFYAAAHPFATDALLLVEVNEPAIGAERTAKLTACGQAGVPEVWLVDLPGRFIDVYREPTSFGYRRIYRARRGERLAPEALAAARIQVDQVLL